MTDFLTRVVLIDGTDADYFALDRAMHNCHFAKVIKSGFGQTYGLPPGTYFSQGHGMDATAVRNLALVAARQFEGRVDILVTGGETAFFLHPSAVPKP